MRERKKLLFILAVFAVSVYGRSIENSDKPLKGMWGFNPVKVWAVDNAGVNILSKGSFVVGKNEIYTFLTQS